MSILVSGGGKRMGQIIGATNSKGEHPIQRELTPQTFRSMIFHRLGIDYRQTFIDQAVVPFKSRTVITSRNWHNHGHFLSGTNHAA